MVHQIRLTGTRSNYILEIAWLKVYGVINFSAAYDLRHYQNVDRLLQSVPTPPRYQYLLVTGAKTRTKPNHVKTLKRVTWNQCWTQRNRHPFSFCDATRGSPSAMQAKAISVAIHHGPHWSSIHSPSIHGILFGTKGIW